MQLMNLNSFRVAKSVECEQVDCKSIWIVSRVRVCVYAEARVV